MHNPEPFATIPIVIGVTGHRNIPAADVPALRHAVQTYLQNEVISKYAKSPVIVLSALAEGADRIVANAALELHCQVGVFLPFAVEEYLRDFETEQSKAEFRELLAKAAFVEVAPSITGGDPFDRNQGYVAVGVTIARFSQCLIALWDGIPGEKPGGTADVIRVYQTDVPLSRPMPDDIIAIPECGPVVHFPVRRSGDPDANPGDRNNLEPRFLPPIPAGLNTDTTSSSAADEIRSKSEKARLDKMFYCINRFNEDAAELHSPECSNPYNAQDLIPSGNIGVADNWPQSDKKARRIAQLYAAADAISFQSQQERSRGFKNIIALSLIAAFFAQVYSGPLSFPLVLAISIIFALLAWSQYLQIGHRHLEEKYLDYRTLAEAARVQFFWHLSGLPDCPADHYLRDQRDELEWLRNAIRALDLPVKTPATETSVRTGIGIALVAWVGNQLAYFRRKTTDHEVAAMKNIAKASHWFLAAICAVLFTAVFHAMAKIWLPGLHESAIPTLTVIYGMFFAISAAFKVYGGIMAHQEQANRYRKMTFYYGLCNSRVEQSLAKGDLKAAQQLLLITGRQALAENAEWLLLHRQRPVEPMLGG